MLTLLVLFPFGLVYVFFLFFLLGFDVPCLLLRSPTYAIYSSYWFNDRNFLAVWGCINSVFTRIAEWLRSSMVRSCTISDSIYGFLVNIGVIAAYLGMV